jgi:hypothetical protein
MKTFEFTQDFESHKKGEKMDYDVENYHGFQHPLVMRGILKVAGKTIEKQSDFDLNRDGIVDDKDMSLAGKTLAESKKFKKVK